MKAVQTTILTLVTILSTSAFARAGDAIQNNCQLSKITDKAETALYDAVELHYNTVLVTFDCDKEMIVDGGLTITSPFTLVFNESLKKDLQSIAFSGKSVPVVFIDEGYNVRPTQIENIKNFPAASALALRLNGVSTYAFEKETQYHTLDQVLDQAGAVRVPETQVNYKNPQDTRPSWKKSFHFVSKAKDFEIKIVQRGPFFFRAWQVPMVSVDMAYILTTSEISNGVAAAHTLTLEDSGALRSLLKANFVSSSDFSSTQQVDCRKKLCVVKIIKSN